MSTTIQKAEDLREQRALAWDLSFANGYFEMGMLGQALHELRKISPRQQDKPEVMALRLRILLARRNWPNVIENAERAVRMFPHIPEFYVHAAAAYDMMGRTASRDLMWQTAPENVRTSGVLHLHVARFEASLGNFISAKEHLRRAFKLEPGLLILAGKDPELAKILSENQNN